LRKVTFRRYPEQRSAIDKCSSRGIFTAEVQKVRQSLSEKYTTAFDQMTRLSMKFREESITFGMFTETRQSNPHFTPSFFFDAEIFVDFLAFDSDFVNR